MKKIRSSLLSSLFPWLSPLVMKFAIVHGGIEVQLSKNNRVLQNWHPLQLQRVLPEQLTKWITDHHIHMGPQPYPLIKQLWQALLPLASKKLLIDSSDLAQLEEGSQPLDFVLVWQMNRPLERFEVSYEGADRYLGMGWFQKGTKIWLSSTQLPGHADALLRNPIIPLAQADFLLNTVIPGLQQYLPTRADFLSISDLTVQVVASSITNRGFTLALLCNYPQLLSGVQLPQQKIDVLLAKQALVRFPQQALTPAMRFLLQSGSSLSLEGIGVPLFMKNELPIMQHYRQISDDTVTKITQAHPIVPIASLKPTFSYHHAYDHGIGKYSITATYQHQQHPLDMDALLAAGNRNQQFVQQHATWFEWSGDSRSLIHTIMQHRLPQILRSEEVMGFDTRRTVLLLNGLTASSIQLIGETPAERGQSVVKQLLQHGVPGGFVGDSTKLTKIFVNACETVLYENKQARILWLVPSNKKGAVTRAIKSSAANSYVTVASPVTLRDEPSLISRSWAVIIFQELDQLLDGGPLTTELARFSWRWALVSMTSKRRLHPSILRVLHLPEQYAEQFAARYLFDIEQSSSVAVPQTTPPSNTLASRQHITNILQQKTVSSTPIPVQPPSTSGDHPIVHLSAELIAKLQEESEQLRARLSILEEQEAQITGSQPVVHLNTEFIAKLQGESEQLRARLVVLEEEQEVQLNSTLTPVSTTVAPPVATTSTSEPEVDEDWKIIYPQWQLAHWEILIILCQAHSTPLSTVERKYHRPVSLLIDEVNRPVDEQFGDVLIKPDTQTISEYFRETAERLIHWHLSTGKGR